MFAIVRQLSPEEVKTHTETLNKGKTPPTPNPPSVDTEQPAAEDAKTNPESQSQPQDSTPASTEDSAPESAGSGEEGGESKEEKKEGKE